MTPISKGRYGRLPTFLRFLSTVPDPQSLVRALQEGPLRPFGASGTLLFVRTSDDVIMQLGALEVHDEILDRYSMVPLTLDMPLTNACREGRSVVAPLTDLADSFPALAMDRHVWEELDAHGGPAYCAAIMSEGASIGLFSFLVDDEKALEPVDLHVIEALRYALGMWLSRPEITLRVADQRHFGSSPFTLSPRQREIILLIEAGLTNSEIGERLGYSTSLVKQEVQRLMRGMRVEGRIELVERLRALDML